jgi:hypothetical protein
MTDALRDYRSIWRVTTLQRQAGIGRFMRGMALLLLVVAVLFVGSVIWRHKPFTWDVARVVLGLGTFWLALMWLF